MKSYLGDSPLVIQTKKCLFLTDLHILNEGTHRAKILLAVLDNVLADQIDTIVLMGDIFDFFFGATRFHHQKFRSIGTKLEDLTAKGVGVYFIQGNHEFSLNKLSWKGVQVLVNRPLVIEHEHRRIAVCHGDKFDPPLAYRIYLTFVSSRLFQFIVSHLPQSKLDRWCLSVSSASREKDDLSTINHQSILRSANQWAMSLEADTCVFGHFHIPYSLKSKDQVSLVSCHDWSQPNVLILKEGKFIRKYLSYSNDIRFLFEKNLRV